MRMDIGRDLLTACWINVPGNVPTYFGVSAYSADEAFRLIKAEGYVIDPRKAQLAENVAARDLDQEHVVPNMGVNNA